MFNIFKGSDYEYADALDLAGRKAKNGDPGKFHAVAHTLAQERYQSFLGPLKFRAVNAVLLLPGVLMLFDDNKAYRDFMAIKFYFYDRGELSEEDYFNSRMRDASAYIKRAMIITQPTERISHPHKVTSEIGAANTPNGNTLILRDVSNTQGGDMLLRFHRREDLDQFVTKLRLYSGKRNDVPQSKTPPRKSMGNPFDEKSAIQQPQINLKAEDLKPLAPAAMNAAVAIAPHVDVKLTRDGQVNVGLKDKPRARQGQQPAVSVMSPKKEGGWSCHVCTFENTALALACSMCRSERTKDPEGAEDLKSDSVARESDRAPRPASPDMPQFEQYSYQPRALVDAVITYPPEAQYANVNVVAHKVSERDVYAARKMLDQRVSKLKPPPQEKKQVEGKDQKEITPKTYKIVHEQDLLAKRAKALTSRW